MLSLIYLIGIFILYIRCNRQVKDNYGWNIAVMKGQVELLIAAYQEFQAYVQQVNQVADYICNP